MPLIMDRFSSVYSEYATFWRNKLLQNKQVAAICAFQALDFNRNNQISILEFKRILDHMGFRSRAHNNNT